MWENLSIKKSRSFIERQLEKKEKTEAIVRPAITISRQEGAGGLTVASSLVNYLEQHTASREPWTVFSQHLVAKVLEEHKHDKSIGTFMKEDHKGTIIDAFEQFFGLHPSTWTLVQQTNATILRLAQIGNVILVGRGANIVTAELENVFHIYLVGSFDKRVEQAQKVFSLDRKAAINYIKKKDEARKRYVKDNFDKDINDPLLYHVVINTDLVSHDNAARMVGTEIIKRFGLDVPVKAATRK